MTTTATMTRVAVPSARVVPLTLTALGVVYGDIGTSPLYTIRECFYGTHAVPVTAENVLGVLSMVLYALVIVISIKYIAIVMRADNQGEGGILALTALVPARGMAAARRARPILIGLGIFGAALLYGDGMITPAISVLGAVEGLQVETPLFAPYVVPMSVAILVVLFLFQKYGTHRVGRLFGPIMVVWFVTIAGLGVSWIVREPGVIAAINPVHAARYFQAHGIPGTGVELFRPGGPAAAQRRGRAAAVLPARAVVGALPAGRHRDCRRHHRVAGAHLRRLLADAAGDSARVRPAPRHRAHLVARDGAGVRAAGELGADDLHDSHRHRLRLVERAGRRLWHRRHDDDGDHGAAAPCHRGGTVEVAAAAGARDHVRLPDDRPHLLRRQPAEAVPGRLAGAEEGEVDRQEDE